MIDWKSKIDNAKDFYQIYWDGNNKYIRIYGYYYDEGEDDGKGSTRLVEYSEFNLLLRELIEYGFDYDGYAESCKQYITDMEYESAINNMSSYFGSDININELAMSELNMETPVGYYVDK